VNTVDQIFGRLMISLGVAQCVTRELAHPPLSDLKGLVVWNSSSDDYQRVSQCIARPAQLWARPSIFADPELAACGGARMACASPAAAQLANAGDLDCHRRRTIWLVAITCLSGSASAHMGFAPVWIPIEFSQHCCRARQSSFQALRSLETSKYSNIAFGRKPGHVTADTEGMDTVRHFAATSRAW